MAHALFPQGRSGLLSTQSGRSCPDNLLPPVCCYSQREGVEGLKNLHRGPRADEGTVPALPHTGFALLDCICPVILIYPLRVSY